jgi:hypothetical protein
MRISEIRNSQEFQDLCQQLLAAEYEDFEILDGSSGDGARTVTARRKKDYLPFTVSKNFRRPLNSNIILPSYRFYM